MAGLRLDLGPAKEPLGMVRGMQWFFSIFCFAICGGFHGDVSFLLSCHGHNNTVVKASFGYPFRLNEASFQPSPSALCGPPLPSPPPSYLRGDFSPSARFFVTVAVLAFLYSAAAIAAYLGWMHRYRAGGGAWPTVDLAVTALLAFLWLCSSSAWGKALTDIHSSVGSPLPHCSPPNVTCFPGDVTSMRSLSVSVILGFLNLILWVGGCWFVYKETPFHRPPSAGPTTAPGAI